MESFSIEFRALIAILFLSEDSKQGELTLNTFDWDGARLEICADQEMDAAVTILLVREIDGNETNSEGSFNETDTKCALFELEENPISTYLQTYNLVTIGGNGTNVGTASFSVDSTYMLLCAEIDLIS